MSEKFDKNIKKLQEICRNIQKAKEANILKLGSGKKINPIMKYFNNYTRIYDKTEPSEHIPDVLALFKRHRLSIVKNQDDSWLREKNVTLQYCDGLKETQDVKIMLSAFYVNAVQVKNEVELQAEGLGQEALEDKIEILYPDLLRLYVYRIIYEAMLEEGETIPEKEKKDREAIKKIISDLESDLDLKPEDTPETASTSATNAMSGFNLQGILGEAAKLAKSHGINGQIPSGNDLGSMFGKLLNDPKIKDVFGGFINDLQNVKSTDQILPKLGETLGKIVPELSNSLTKKEPEGNSSVGSDDGSGVGSAPPISTKSEEKLLMDM